MFLIHLHLLFHLVCPFWLVSLDILISCYLYCRFLDLGKSHEDGDSKAAAMKFVENMEKLIPEGMDLDTVTTLARVQFARVIIRTLDLKDDDVEKYTDW